MHVVFAGCLTGSFAESTERWGSMVPVDDHQEPWPPPGGSQGPTDGQILSVGGWDERYARVLLKVTDRQAALTIVDSNGDGSELEIDVLHYEAGGWVSAGSSGLGALVPSPSEASGRSGRVVWAAGVLEPGSVVTVRFGPAKSRVVVVRSGLWAWVFDAGDGEPDGAVWPEVSWIPPDPAGRSRMLFRSEVGADSPFWADDVDEGSDYLVDVGDLPLSSELARAVTEWASTAWNTPGNSDTRRHGRELCALCARELQRQYELLWDG